MFYCDVVVEALLFPNLAQLHLPPLRTIGYLVTEIFFINDTTQLPIPYNKGK